MEKLQDYSHRETDHMSPGTQCFTLGPFPLGMRICIRIYLIIHSNPS